MAKSKSSFTPAAGLFSTVEQNDTTMTNNENIQSPVKSSVDSGENGTGSKPIEPIRKQTSHYLPLEQIERIEDQCGVGTRKKERDRSSIVRAALDIYLNLSKEQDNNLKERALRENKTVAEIVSAAIDAYL
jgi:predicted DNA-binding protein